MAGDDHEMSEGNLNDQEIAVLEDLIWQMETLGRTMDDASKVIAKMRPYQNVAFAALVYYDETEKVLGATGKRADRGAWTELVKAIRALREAEKEQA